MKPLYLITLSSLLLSCGKESKAPPRTTNGANILVCKVNGAQHVYDDGFAYYMSPNGVSYERGVSNFTGPCIDIYASEADYDDAIDIRVHDTNAIVNKVYILSEQPDQRVAKDRGVYSLNSTGYMSKSGYIKFDRLDNEVAAGEFAFTAYNAAGGKMEITEGYFDMQRYIR